MVRQSAKKLVGLFLLPMIFFSAMGAYQTLFHSPRLTRLLHDYNFMSSDLQGFNTTLRYLEKSPPIVREKMSGNIQRIHGYLIHAKTLLLDIRTRQKSLPGPDRKRIIRLIGQIDNLIGDIRHAPPVPPDPANVFSLSQQTFPILLTLSRMTRSTLLISQKTNSQIILFQVLDLLMFLGLVAILLAWLEGYRKHLRNMAIYEALNVSVSGIAFLPVSMDRFDAVNRGFEELTGYRSSELIGTSNPPVDPHFGHSAIQNPIRDLIDNRIGVLSFDTHIFSRDRNLLHLHVRLEKTIFEGHTRIVATVENRTEEKKLQDELLLSRNHLATLFRHLGDGVMELDPEGNILFLNATGERLLGYLSDELSGLPASTLFSPSGSMEETFVSPETFILSRIRHAAPSGDSYETEAYSLIKKTGEQMDSSLIFTPLFQGPDNTLKEIVVVFRDIGSRKRLQKKLRKSEEKYRKMIQSTPDGIVLFDPRSLQVLEANPSFASMVGVYFTETLIGKEITEFIPEIREKFQESGHSPPGTGIFDSGNIRIKRSDRTSILASIKETVIPYEEQDAILLVIRDITSQSLSEAIRKIFHLLDEQILENHPIEETFTRLLQTLLQSLSLGISAIIARNPDGRLEILALAESISDDTDTVRQLLETMINDPDSSSASALSMQTGKVQVVESGKYREPYKTFFRKNHIESSAFFPVKLPGQPPLATVGISVFNKSSLSGIFPFMEDLADKLAVAYLHENEQKQIRLQKIATESVNTPMFIAGPGGALEWANNAYLESKGCNFSEVSEFPGYFFSRNRDMMMVNSPFWESIRLEKTFTQQYVSPRKGGTDYPVEIRISPVFGTNNELLHFVCLETDLTSMKLEEEELRKKAYFDPLTRLANRNMMERELIRSLEIAKRYMRSMALMFLDLDGFKEVNDNFGHDFGDKLLVEVAGRLDSLVRKGDFVARLGGDEFVIILNNVLHPGEVKKAAKRILEAIHAPYSIDGHSVTIGTSIGISVFPEDNKDASGLLRDADQAMYQAKNRGKNNFVLYTPGPLEEMGTVLFDREPDPVMGDDDEPMVLNPVRSLCTGKITGFSFSAFRSTPGYSVDPDSSTITPPEEKRQFLQTARTTAEKISVLYPGAFLKISLLFHQVLEPDFYPIFDEIFENIPRPSRSRIMIGLRGMIPFSNPFVQPTAISRLAEDGFSIGIERVGDQENTLLQLRLLPVQFLELSHTLVRDMSHEANALAILGSIFLLGNSLDKQLIVPAVDDVETSMILKRLGFDWCTGITCGDAIPPFDPGLASARDEPWKKYTEEFHVQWDPEHISYLLGRKTHREILSNLGNGISEGSVPQRAGHSSLSPCPMSYWLSRKSTGDILGSLGVSQLEYLEERFHQLADENDSAFASKYRTKENGKLDALRGVSAEMRRLSALAEKVLFGGTVPEKI